MRKITDFIVDKRYFILALFIIFSIIAAIFSTKVNINYDIAKYLPGTSATRIGMDIMEDEFSDDESTLNLMFENLTDDEKLEIKAYLETIEGVSNVDYDNTENYNKENYTLYIISVDGKSDSETAGEVYNQISEKYKDYTFSTSGAVSNANKPVLKIWVVVLAVACALVILIIMCESYVEPFLFLIAILMAVLLNKGSNVIFGTVSHITNAIAAILQLALSMDYSIMLMNRYRQEKERETDNVKAMKNALYNAFQAISSSSITTIVGLLALVFMTFQIGKDLGFVLAKGVLFSLVCIFFVLPSLVLMFDKLITKTAKKVPNIKLNKLAKFSHKIRYAAVPVFLIVFIAGFVLKGNLGIDYTATQSDEISTVFAENNQMAIIYKNGQEDTVAKHLKEIEDNEKIDEMLAYGNTIGEKLTFDKLNERLSDLDSDVNIEDYLLKILYYDYYNPNEDNTLTFEEFINFIEEEAYNNDKINGEIDDTTKNNIARLKNFITADSINQKRTSSDIANILEIDKSDIDDVLIYYLSKNNNTTMNLNTFVAFTETHILKNEQYASKMDEKAKSNLQKLSNFTTRQRVEKQITSSEMAKLFGMDVNTIKDLYKYYISINDITTKMTLYDFSNFILNNVAKDSNYSNSFNAETLQNVKMLAIFSDINVINKKMTASELAKLLEIPEMQINQIYQLCTLLTTGKNAESNWQATPNEFVKLILANSDNENIKIGLGEQLGKLQLLSNIMASGLNKTSYTYTELAKFTGMDASAVKNIYILYISNIDVTKISPQEFVDFILMHKNDPALAGKIDSSTVNDLNLIQKVMSDVVSNKKYTSSELASLLSIDKENTKLIYGLYNFKYVDTNPTLSLKEIVNFLLNDVVTNSEYSSHFDDDKISKLNTINAVMNNSLNNTKYTSNEIFALISTLADGIDENIVELLYTYYGSSKQYDDTWQLTIEEFVDFINNDILQDDRFTEFIDDDMRNNITDAKEQIADAKKLLIGDEYSRIVLNTKFDFESPETFEFIQKVKDIFGQDVNDFYIAGDSPMAYEMNQTFNNELNFITVLTMIAIFVVVAITFKSIIVPIILVLTIQCAVFLTMGILSFVGENVYFIAILIVQSILMGATIDYAILYTSYYIEHRKSKGILESITAAYNNSIHTILTSSSILIIVTLVVANFASAIAAKICKTVSEGTLCSTILILTLLPAVLAAFDKFIIKRRKDEVTK